MSLKPSRTYLKDYNTWSFGEKSLKGALYISLMWHVFWFFSVNIIVSPFAASTASKTKTAFVSPVLDDSLFRSIVESRIEESEAYYNREVGLEELSPTPIRTMEKQEVGQVVSIPFGKRFLTSFRQLIGGDKASPEEEYASKIDIGYKGELVATESGSLPDNEYYSLSAGEASSRRVLTTPEPPSVDTLLKRQNTPNLEIEFYLNYVGQVLHPKIIKSSGDTEIDGAYLNYFRKWLFEPAAAGRKKEVYGVVDFDLERKRKKL